MPETGGNYIYGEKYCQKHAIKCTNPAQMYRFPGYKISNNYIKKSKKASSRRSCFELCLKEKKFECR